MFSPELIQNKFSPAVILDSAIMRLTPLALKSAGKPRDNINSQYWFNKTTHQSIVTEAVPGIFGNDACCCLNPSKDKCLLNINSLAPCQLGNRINCTLKLADQASSQS